MSLSSAETNMFFQMNWSGGFRLEMSHQHHCWTGVAPPLWPCILPDSRVFPLFKQCFSIMWLSALNRMREKRPVSRSKELKLSPVTVTVWGVPWHQCSHTCCRWGVTLWEGVAFYLLATQAVNVCSEDSLPSCVCTVNKVSQFTLW